MAIGSSVAAGVGLLVVGRHRDRSAILVHRARSRNAKAVPAVRTDRSPVS